MLVAPRAEASNSGRGGIFTASRPSSLLLGDGILATAARVLGKKTAEHSGMGTRQGRSSLG